MTFDYHMQMPYTQINTRSVSRPVKAVYMPLSIDIKRQVCTKLATNELFAPLLTL